MTDFVNSFLNLFNLDNKKFNEDTYHLFDLVYLNPIPESIAPYFTNTYIFCFFKDPKNFTKLRLITIRSLMWHIFTNHIANNFHH